MWLQWNVSDGPSNSTMRGVCWISPPFSCLVPSLKGMGSGSYDYSTNGVGNRPKQSNQCFPSGNLEWGLKIHICFGGTEASRIWSSYRGSNFMPPAQRRRNSVRKEKLKTKSSMWREVMIEWPIHMVFMGLRALPGHSTISAKSRKFLPNQDELVILSREERSVVPDKDREAALNPDTPAPGEAWLGFLPWVPWTNP